MKRSIVISIALILFALGAVLAWDHWPRRSTFYTDAVSIREPLATATPRDILWQPPVSLPPVINSSADDYEPRMSPDGLTLYFVRGKAGRNADIFVSTRTPHGWSEPHAFVEVNSDSDDLGPEPSADGEALYFYSNRDGGSGGYDLWVARRGDEGWQQPSNLGPAVNTEYNDYGPAISPDGATLYFASNRPAASDARQPDPNAWSATLREDLFHRTYDLYSAAYTNAGLQPASPLSNLNSSFNEGSPSVSPFGDFLYFASDRAGGEGGFDLYRARRLRGEHLAPSTLGVAVNTSANELDPGLSLGGYRLDFSSDRAVEGRAKDGPREYNIYQTISREVFAETEELAQASIDWWALWRVIGPNLLWALLALSLLLLMMWMMGGIRGRRLSLMIKCLLASLAAHLLLMLLFNTMQVASSIAGELRKGRGGPIQIALSPGSSGQGITAQLRAGVSEASSLEMPAMPSSMLRAAPLTVPAPALQPVVSAVLAPSVIRAEHSTPSPATREATPTPRVMQIIERSPQLPSRSHAVDFAALETATPFTAFEESAPAPAVNFAPVRATALVSSHGAASQTNLAVLPATRIEAGPGMVELRPSEATLGRSVGMNTTSIPSLTLQSAATEFALIRAGDPIQGPDTAQPSPRAPATQGIRARAASVVTTSTKTGTTLPLPGPTSRPQSGSLVGGTTANDALPAASIWAAIPGLAPGAAIASLPRWPTTQLGQPSDAIPLGSGHGGGAETSDPSLSKVGAVAAHARPGLPQVAWSLGTRSEPVIPIPNRGTAPVVGGSATLASFDGRFKEGSPLSPPGRALAAANIASPSRTATVELGLPTEQEPLENPYPGRFAENRIDNVEKGSGNKESVDVLGTIHGKVTEAGTRRPLVGATVRLNLPDQSSVVAITESDGTYWLNAPDVPDFFALSASLEGFVPKSINVERAKLEGRTVVKNFTLEPLSNAVMVTESVPDVHHLGDNRFDGTINSQFQKQSEGAEFTIRFQLGEAQLPPNFSRAEVRLMAKGVQRNHRIVINDETLQRRLNKAPEDGSFGEFKAPFDPIILQAGVNTLRIIAAPSSDDIDDFEFVNVQVRLAP